MMISKEKSQAKEFTTFSQRDNTSLLRATETDPYNGYDLTKASNTELGTYAANPKYLVHIYGQTFKPFKREWREGSLQSTNLLKFYDEFHDLILQHCMCILYLCGGR